MKYGLRIVRDDDAYLVYSRDVPEFHTVGYSEEEAMTMAKDGLLLTLSGYVTDRREIPEPKPVVDGDLFVDLPALAVAKIGLSNAMVVQGVNKSELARRLQIHNPQVDRLLSLTHSSKIEAVEDALWKLGYTIDVHVSVADKQFSSLPRLRA